MALVDLPPRLILERLAGELTAQQYKVWRMRVEDGYSFGRISEVMGISKGTAHGHYGAANRRVGEINWELDHKENS